MLSPEQFSHFEKASEMLPEIYQEKGVPELLDKMKKIIREIRGDQTPKEEKIEEFIEEKEAPKKESDSKKQEIQHDDNPRRRNIFEKELPSEEELYSKKKQDKPKENIFHKPV